MPPSGTIVTKSEGPNTLTQGIALITRPPNGLSKIYDVVCVTSEGSKMTAAATVIPSPAARATALGSGGGPVGTVEVAVLVAVLSVVVAVLVATLRVVVAVSAVVVPRALCASAALAGGPSSSISDRSD